MDVDIVLRAVEDAGYGAVAISGYISTYDYIFEVFWYCSRFFWLSEFIRCPDHFHQTPLITSCKIVVKPKVGK